MQPLQCDLQPQIPKDPRTTHTRRNKHCKTPSMNQPHTKTNGPHPPRTRGTFHRWPKPLHTEKTQGFVLRLPPQHKPHAISTQPLQFVLQQLVNIYAAITMRSATTDSKTPYNYARMTKQALQNTIKQPGTNHTPKRTDRTRRAQEVPFIAGRSDFIWNNPRVSLRLPPQNKAHATFIQPLQCVLLQLVYIHAAVTTRSETTDSESPKPYAHTMKQALQNTIKEPITHQNERTAPAAHTRYLSSLAEATSHGKTQGFVLPTLHACIGTWCKDCKVSQRPSWMYGYVM